MSTAYRYRVGGHLPIDDPSYVVRAADRQFYEGLTAGELCYVLNSRQMGKTSLRFRTMHLLQPEGIACVAIDLQGIGSRNITAHQWYAGIVRRIAQGLATDRRFEVRSWWQERDPLSPVQRFSEFVELVLPKFIAERGARQSVIFIDEIDSTLSLDFDADDFFAAIRACSEFSHVTFALIGVAAPGDLVRDVGRSPFNIGRAIELRGFQPDEAHPLLCGLQDKALRPGAVLTAILEWTGGQPFLTQKLCKMIQDLDAPLPSNYEAEFVATLVRTNIIANWETQDEPEHLRTIRNYLVLSDKPHAERSLECYQQILTAGSVLLDRSPAQIELRLSGLVVKDRERLMPSNRIYREIFDRMWLDRALLRFCPYAEELTAWLHSERQDRTHLLPNEALPAARRWAQGKNLDAKHRDFLAASSSRARFKLRNYLQPIAIACGALVAIAAAWLAVKLTTPTPIADLPTPEFPDRELRKQVRILVRLSANQRLHQKYGASLLTAVQATRQFQLVRGKKQPLKILVRENLVESLDRLRGSQQKTARQHPPNIELRSLLLESCQELQPYLNTSFDLTFEQRQICKDLPTDNRK